RYDMLGLSNAAAPRPVFVVAYDDKARQYVTANERFPQALQGEADRLRQAFEADPKGKPPFEYIDGQLDLHEPMGYLVGYVLQMCFLGDPDKAWAYLDAYAAPKTAATLRAAVATKLSSDPYYQDMLRRQSRSTSN